MNFVHSSNCDHINHFEAPFSAKSSEMIGTTYKLQINDMTPRKNVPHNMITSQKKKAQDKENQTQNL